MLDILDLQKVRIGQDRIVDLEYLTVFLTRL